MSCRIGLVLLLLLLLLFLLLFLFLLLAFSIFLLLYGARLQLFWNFRLEFSRFSRPEVTAVSAEPPPFSLTERLLLGLSCRLDSSCFCDGVCPHEPDDESW